MATANVVLTLNGLEANVLQMTLDELRSEMRYWRFNSSSDEELESILEALNTALES